MEPPKKMRHSKKMILVPEATIFQQCNNDAATVFSKHAQQLEAQPELTECL